MKWHQFFQLLSAIWIAPAVPVWISVCVCLLYFVLATIAFLRQE